MILFRKLYFPILLLSSFSVFPQDKKCDCVVKFENDILLLHLPLDEVRTSHKILPKKYDPIKVQPGKKYAYHRVIKDSSLYWVFETHVRDSSMKKNEFTMKKVMSAFIVNVKFKGKDSIPLFTEPDKSSKIVSYLKKDNQTGGDDKNDYWFAGCKNGFIKVVTFEYGSLRGWIQKENYPNK